MKKKVAAIVSIVLIAFVISVYIWMSFSYASFTYPINRSIRYIEASVSSNEVQKANYHLDNVKELVKVFSTEALKPKVSGTRLITLAKELNTEESFAGIHMDLAKRLGKNIKPQAHDLCESLEEQQRILNTLVMNAPLAIQSQLKKELATTNIAAVRAMQWE